MLTSKPVVRIGLLSNLKRLIGLLIFMVLIFAVLFLYLQYDLYDLKLFKFNAKHDWSIPDQDVKHDWSVPDQDSIYMSFNSNTENCCLNFNDRNQIFFPNDGPFLYHSFNGRVGNQLFQYASTYGIARARNMTPLIPNTSELWQMFKKLSAFGKTSDEIKQIQPSFGYHSEPHGASHYDESTETLPRVNTILQGYFISFKYFQKYDKEIRQDFVFKDKIYIKVRNFLADQLKIFCYSLQDTNSTWQKLTCFLKKYKMKSSKNCSEPFKNVTLIGIHVRRGDKVKQPHLIKYGFLVPNKTYFDAAMDYFRNKYKHLLFVVCSDDKTWVKENINYDNVIISSLNPHEDLALLTLMDHVIMSDGSTFGFWGGYLAGGDVLYWKNWPLKGSELSKVINKRDRWPPQWIGLDV